MQSDQGLYYIYIRCLESTIPKLATSEISIFQQVSVADETGLSLALSETPKTGFVATRPNCINIIIVTIKSICLK